MATDSRALQFVQQLAANLAPELDLPAFPQVVRRLQIALVHDETTIRDVVGIVSSEPVLSARFMQMANSAALNPNRTPVASLNNAVNRLGFNLVRTVSTAFALRQLSRDSSLGAIRPDLEQVWKTSNMIASICFAVAKQAFGRQPDEAMMVGLLHSIGRLYILMHAHHTDPAMRNDPDFATTLAAWQPVIGQAILESWGLPRRICEAVGNQDYLLGGGSADLEPLTRLLSAAKLHHRLNEEPELRTELPDAAGLLNSVNLGKGSFVDLVAASQTDIAEMQQALAA
ncbi:MAG: HDOD domain-containing protein [Gammaproteobacteria bacterium]|nr:HDOD domain-containing protein [Gammaproteobacteria bacterium]